MGQTVSVGLMHLLAALGIAIVFLLGFGQFSGAQALSGNLSSSNPVVVVTAQNVDTDDDGCLADHCDSNCCPCCHSSPGAALASGQITLCVPVIGSPDFSHGDIALTSIFPKLDPPPPKRAA
jgi:hypothetical protein